MPSGVYIHKSEDDKKRADALRGKERPKFSDEWKHNMSEVQKGKKHSEETKKKIALAISGKPGPWLGKKRGPMSFTTKRKISEKNKGRLHSDVARHKMSIAAIERIKKGCNGSFKPSQSETAFLDALEKLFGTKFERQFELGGRFFDGRDGNLLIEVDGKRYHILPKQQKVDVLKNKIAEDNGYTLIRFNISNMNDVHKFAEEYGIPK